MTREESIELAGKLKTEYRYSDLILKEITDHKACLEDIIPADEGAGISDYIKPWFIAAVLSALGTSFANILLSFVLFVVIIITGFIVSACRCRNFIKTLAQELSDTHTRNEKLLSLYKQLNEQSKRLRTYNSLVPSLCRTESSMDWVLDLLKNNKAKDFEEAVGYVHQITRRKAEIRELECRIKANEESIVKLNTPVEEHISAGLYFRPYGIITILCEAATFFISLLICIGIIINTGKGLYYGEYMHKAYNLSLASNIIVPLVMLISGIIITNVKAKRINNRIDGRNKQKHMSNQPEIDELETENDRMKDQIKYVTCELEALA